MEYTCEQPPRHSKLISQYHAAMLKYYSEHVRCPPIYAIYNKILANLNPQLYLNEGVKLSMRAVTGDMLQLSSWSATKPSSSTVYCVEPAWNKVHSHMVASSVTHASRCDGTLISSVREVLLDNTQDSVVSLHPHMVDKKSEWARMKVEMTQKEKTWFLLIGRTIAHLRMLWHVDAMETWDTYTLKPTRLGRS